ncbi:MAG: GNAT family N-acetyltransferase [Hyphomicrobiales bacterium]|nr:GNAT family N-acetyltransferase [Hyphomicrobiales bacterium]
MNTALSNSHKRTFGVHEYAGKAEPVTLVASKTTAGPGPSGSYELSFHNTINNLEAAWRELEQRSNVSIYQRFDWINSCLQTIGNGPNNQPLIVTAYQGGRLVLILPLSVSRGLIKTISWIGGSHSNFKLPLMDRDFASHISNTEIVQIFDEISQLFGGFGCISLCCMPGIWAGQANPMLALPHQKSTNQAFGSDLSGGFQNVLKRGNGKRKRKKFRWQSRVVESLGGTQFVEAGTRSEALEILSCFHLQKSKRLREQGIKDIFGGQKAQQFLKKIALNSHFMEEPLLKLFALKIDGEYRAICGGGVINQHFSTYFISFADDDLAHISPGEMLIYMLVEKLAESGFQSMDMGCGEERFKQSWCPETVEMFDAILPLSKTSIGYVWLYRGLLDIRRYLRQNSITWKHFKRVRVVFRKAFPVS